MERISERTSELEMKGLLPFTPSLPLNKPGFLCFLPLAPRAPRISGASGRALKTAQVPWSHQKVPESLTHWFREELPKNRNTKSQATQEWGALRGHRVQVPLSAGLPGLA